MTTQRLLKVTLASLSFSVFLGLSVTAVMAAPPANDSFSSASEIDLNALPFSNTANMTEATTENGEQQYCSFSYQTVWYKLTPTTGIWLKASTLGSSFFGSGLSVWRDTGAGIFGLNFVICANYGDPATFFAQAGTTYYVQQSAPCCFVPGNGRVNVEQVPPPVPVANFYFYPSDPSFFDTVQFYDNSNDPGQVGIQSRAWNFGDGSTAPGDTASGCCPTHRYGADGVYTVHLVVTTFDGRTAETSQVVTVKTHDVAITKFKVPQSASAGQTRQISVGIRNTRYPENVRVQLEKSVPGGYYGGYQTVGYLDQLVPVRSSNRTTDFTLSYTFTKDDASLGKVTFRAVASINYPGRDAFPADNEAISSPVKVSGSGTAPVVAGAAEVVSGADEAIGGETRVPVAQLAILDVSPNPAKAGVELLVHLSVPAGATATLQVIDVAGRVMAKREVGSLGVGIQEARVAWERRPAPGIYWVRLTQGDKAVTMRVGILR